MQESGEIAARLRAAGLCTGGPGQGRAAAARDVVALLRAAGPSEALHVVAGHARQAIGADLGAVVVPGPDGVVVIDAADGHGAELLRGAAHPAGRLWQSMLAGGEVIAADISLDAEVADLAGPLRLGPLLMVPLVAGGRLFGALALARLRSRPVFTAADLQGANILAGYAALGLTWAEDHRQGTGRSRVADDLHDVVLGRLFATGLRLQAIPATDLGAGAAEVAAAIAELDLAMADIRAAIQNLQLAADPVPHW